VARALLYESVDKVEQTIERASESGSVKCIFLEHQQITPAGIKYPIAYSFLIPIFNRQCWRGTQLVRKWATTYCRPTSVT